MRLLVTCGDDTFTLKVRTISALSPSTDRTRALTDDIRDAFRQGPLPVALGTVAVPARDTQRTGCLQGTRQAVTDAGQGDSATYCNGTVSVEDGSLDLRLSRCWEMLEMGEWMSAYDVVDFFGV